MLNEKEIKEIKDRFIKKHGFKVTYADYELEDLAAMILEKQLKKMR